MMKAEIIYFSATGTTRKIVKAISQGLDCEVHFTDINLPDSRERYQPVESDLVVMATPIYGERIPRFVYDFFKLINGNGRPLAVVSVYGNMGYGISLAQFKDLAEENSFRLFAAGAFIAEHSYASKRAPVGLGRPNANDLKQAAEFGREIRRKFDAGNCTPAAILKPTIPKFITHFPDTGTRILIRQPAVKQELCNRCGACAKRCPAGAIDPKTLRIDEQKCIRCYACVKTCPKSARVTAFRLQFMEKVFGNLGRKKKDNIVFI